MVIEVEFWDNNVVVQIPLTKYMESYQVGLSLSSLSDKKKTNKYKHEKDTKVMKTMEEKGGKARQ